MNLIAMLLTLLLGALIVLGIVTDLNAIRSDIKDLRQRIETLETGRAADPTEKETAR